MMEYKHLIDRHYKLKNRLCKLFDIKIKLWNDVVNNLPEFEYHSPKDEFRFWGTQINFGLKLTEEFTSKHIYPLWNSLNFIPSICLLTGQSFIDFFKLDRLNKEIGIEKTQ